MSAFDFVHFQTFAEGYILEGDIETICDHNDELASKCGRIDISTVWRLVKRMYTIGNVKNLSLEHRKAPSVQEMMKEIKLMRAEEESIYVEPMQLRKVEEIKSMEVEESKPMDVGEAKPLDVGEAKPPGAEALKKLSFETDDVTRALSALCIPVDEEDNDNILDRNLAYIDHRSSERSHQRKVAAKSSFNPHLVAVAEDAAPVAPASPPNCWHPLRVMEDILNNHSRDGDFQTSVCVLIALGSNRHRVLIDQKVQDEWLDKYVHRLRAYKLYHVLVSIGKLVWVPTVTWEIEKLSKMMMECEDCSKPLKTLTWYCDPCRAKLQRKCALCQQAVNGMSFWCSICRHGGHMSHALTWFQSNYECPVEECHHMCKRIMYE